MPEFHSIDEKLKDKLPTTTPQESKELTGAKEAKQIAELTREKAESDNLANDAQIKLKMRELGYKELEDGLAQVKDGKDSLKKERESFIKEKFDWAAKQKAEQDKITLKYKELEVREGQSAEQLVLATSAREEQLILKQLVEKDIRLINNKLQIARDNVGYLIETCLQLMETINVFHEESSDKNGKYRASEDDIIILLNTLSRGCDAFRWVQNEIQLPKILPSDDLVKQMLKEWQSTELKNEPFNS